MTSTGGAAVAAAAAKAAKDHEEEERLTGYNNSDIEGWEFKIVRSTFGRFNNPEIMKRICQEEAAAGWELLEKFDDYRLRFKRRVEARKNDLHLKIDPYRTSTSFSGSRLAWILPLAIIMAVGLIIALVLMNRQ
jgi:hypothetical protein